jgi:hypothetical protein
MSLERRITAIKLVQRIKQHEIDGFAANLAAIRAQQADLQNELRNLIQMRDREGHASTIEAAPYLASFLRSVKSRSIYLDEQLAELDREATDIELQLQTAFAESKANEAALSKAEDEVKLERERMEIAASEEIARNMYLRRRRKVEFVP